MEETFLILVWIYVLWNYDLVALSFFGIYFLLWTRFYTESKYVFKVRTLPLDQKQTKPSSGYKVFLKDGNWKVHALL